jgi:crotonobetaine/carnitine-CoA ligase
VHQSSNRDALSQDVIGAVLRDQAAVAGDDPYLLMDERTLTFGEANRSVNSLAFGLTEMGIGKGDRISILMENSLEFILIALAANKIGAVWTPINTSYFDHWLGEAIEGGDSTLLVLDDGFVDRVLSLGLEGGGPTKRAVVLGRTEAMDQGGIQWFPFAHLDSGRTDEPNSDVEYGDLATIIWTSGTTGRSKGAMLSHGYIPTQVPALLQMKDARAGDVFYSYMPMYYGAAWLSIWEGLYAGLPVAVDKAFSVGGFWDRIRHYGATQALILGAMLIYLWEAPELPTDRDNPLRIAGSAPVPPPEIREPFMDRFGLEGIWSGYGQTEAPLFVIRHALGTYKPGSAGLPRDDVELKILDDMDLEVPVGEVGEICIRPRTPYTTFQGYFRQPEVTLETFRNLWLHTGDLGRVDEDGELFFVDRKADFVRHKGRNLASFDAERAAMAHSGVYEVAAHGIPAEEVAQEDELKLCVVRAPESDLTAEELATFINDTAPYFMVPRYIEFVAELPHTPSGKVQKHLLRQRGVTPETWDRIAAGFEVRR